MLNSSKSNAELCMDMSRDLRCRQSQVLPDEKACEKCKQSELTGLAYVGKTPVLCVSVLEASGLLLSWK